ncbi:MAG: hypothetical protein H6737_12795 [Alphaproteobacteria bacterium]|nr:hypothetical protein [Alphaproteobacteria bacterium]
MATLTKITKFRRKLRRKKMGRDRKAAAEANGTTPAFEIHSADAVKNAPKDQLKPEHR